MRKLLLGLSLALLTLKAGYAAGCADTTVLVQAGSPGWDNTAKVYTPGALNAINDVIRNCTDATITVRLKFNGDTLKLGNEILVTGRNSKTTRIVGEGTGFDNLLTLTESVATDPQLLQVQPLNTTILNNLGFARKSVGSSAPGGNGTPSVLILADSSQVSGCEFFNGDNTSNDLVYVLDIVANAVLVEKSLFRALPEGLGRPTGLHTGGNANRVEIRSCVFFSTGMQLAATGAVHVIANTFAGSRGWSSIIVGGSVVAPEKSINIQHNLFVPRWDTLPPITFAGPLAASDSILANAWSRGKTNLPLAVATPAGGGTSTVVLNGNLGINVNTPLPRGFSNYGPLAYNVKDYPLTTLRTDPTLQRKSADFGKMFKVFTNSNWTGMADIKDFPTSKLYFPGGFTPYINGKTWLAAVKVGAFVDQDNIETPTPLDSGAQGTALKFSPLASDSATIVIKTRNFDADYYKSSTLVPQTVSYFFSDTLSKLASNDSAVLRAAVKTSNIVSRPFLNEDSTLAVPREVRLGADIPFYVKMLHYRQGLQAVVQSSAVIATVKGVPSFPRNDLAIKVDTATSDFLLGRVNLIVTRGAETIDSVFVVAATEGGQLVDTASKAAIGSSLTFSFDLAKGTYSFFALPIAKLNGSLKSGQATKNTPFVTVRPSSDTIYVTPKAGPCTGDGLPGSTSYSCLASALKDIDTSDGGTIVIKNGTVAMEDVVIAPNSVSDTEKVTIITTLGSGKYDENRPSFRGNAKEALTITRKNVTLKGFFIEMPVGSTNTALNIRGDGALVEGNIFRAVAKGAVEGIAVNIDVGASANARFVNNLVWGFTKNVQITTPGSANIRVVNNTFVDDPALTSNTGKTVGVQAAGTGAMSAVFANNYFSGIAAPIDATLKDNKTAILDHNVFTGKFDLQGMQDAGAFDSSGRVPSADLWVSGYVRNLETALAIPIECSVINACNPLYAGSSTAGYSTNTDKDVFGKARTNKHEVGAFELASSASNVIGVLSITASVNDTDYTRIPWVVTAKTFDLAEADSVFVYWGTTDLGTPTDARLLQVPSSRQKHFPAASLGSGTLADVATGISEENTDYIFAVVLVRRDSSTGSKLYGHPYTFTIKSGVNVNPGDCEIESATSACPSGAGQFIVKGGPYADLFTTRVTFTEAVTTGLVKNPEFLKIDQTSQVNLDLRGPLPMIRLFVTIPNLGGEDSKQTFTANITMAATPDLSGFSLFQIPDDSTKEMARFVPTWSYKVENNKTVITIESNVSGSQSYAFGKLMTGLKPGVVVSTVASVPVFDFTTNRDSSVLHVPVKFKGTGFKTANPLVMVSVIPAGGVITPTGGRVGNVISPAYHSKTLVLSSGFSNLDEALQQDGIYRYYKRAAAFEAASTMAMGHKKPFLLDSTISRDDFVASTKIQGGDLAVTAGALGEITLDFPVSRTFKDFDRYADQTGKASRSLEVEYTVFDGSEISRSRSFIRTKFSDGELHITEKKTGGYERSAPGAPKWNLIGYPWDEADTGSLARIVDRPKWDNDNMRLMWYKGTGKGAASFNIYDGGNNSEIKFDSGMASWSGSTSPYTPSTATGMSLDFESFKMPLAPGQWTDIALPFNFPINWTDVLDSSGIPRTPRIDAFHYNIATRGFEPLEVGSASPPVAASVLKPWEGYTVRPSNPVTLVFPVLDTARSNTTAAKIAAKTAAGSDGSWTARLVATNASASMYLRIGKGSSEALVSEAPDAPGQNFRMTLLHSRPAGDEKVSNYIQAMDGDWQGHWALKASAEQGAGGITLRLEGASRNVPIHLVETLSKTAVPLTADAPITLSESELNANDYHLVAGGKDYLDRVLSGLVPLHMLALSNSPNPFAGATLIRYALPESFGRVSFNMKVRDFRGRTIWEKTIKGGNSLSYLWDGHDRMNSPLPAGVYQLTLEASVPGKPVFKANRRMLRM
jgi:hypothetical protein